MTTVREMRRSVSIRYEFFHAPADQFRARAAEEPLGLLVRETDRSLMIDLEDRIGRRFKELTEPAIH